MPVRILSDADVRAVLDPAECERAMVDALRAYSLGDATNPLRSVWGPEGAGGVMGLMPSHGSGAYGLKSLCIVAANAERGIDTHQGTVTLFDGETGMAIALLNASALTEIRTAAVSAAATRELAVPDASVLCVLGAGVQGRAHLRSLAGVRAWSEIRVCSRSPDRATALVSEVAAARVVASAREAVTGADVVVCATSSRTPVFEHQWLAPRAHVCAVGAPALLGHELPVETVAGAAWWCDSREAVLAEALEFRLAVEAGAVPGIAFVRGEIGELFAGRVPGREPGDGVTVFRSLGIGVEDLAAARLALERAAERDVGVEVEL